MPPKNEYKCDICDFIVGTKREYSQHLRTYKHRLAIGDPSLDKKNLVSCPICGDMFGSRTTLWRHKKTCNQNKTQTDSNGVSQFIEITSKKRTVIPVIGKCENDASKNEQYYEVSESVLNEVLRETKNLRDAFEQQNVTIETLKQVNMQQNKIIEEALPKLSTPQNITHVTNDHSQNFNINLFLNEQCKNALNMSEFVRSIVVQIDDLERTKSLGYVKGVSSIIINNLNKLDIYKRPIHCSDPLQEIMYVKHDNIWSQENEDKPIVRSAINAVAKKQIEKVIDWESSNNNTNRNNEKSTEEFMRLIKHATTTEEEGDTRILKNIAREVVINKSSK